MFGGFTGSERESRLGTYGARARVLGFLEKVDMAGMFYSLKEAAKKLGRTEDQVKQLVKENKLREFRDGSNLLFKIEEVNALLAEGVAASAEDLTLEEPPAQEPAEALGDTAVAALG